MSHHSKLKKEAACAKSADGKALPLKSEKKLGKEEIIAMAKPKPMPMFHCVHKDCKYRFEAYHTYSCDYMSITGQSRMLWHKRRGLSDRIEDCQLYEKGKSPQRKQIIYTANSAKHHRKKKEPKPTAKANNIYTANSEKQQRKKKGPKPKQNGNKYLGLTFEKLSRLVRAGLYDNQIALLHGCSKANVYRARQEYKITSACKQGYYKDKLSMEEALRIYEDVFGKNVQRVRKDED